MNKLICLMLSVIIGCFPVIILAQNPAPQQQPQQQDDDVIRTRTAEVKLDVVVKDKKGRPIKDLKAGDFEVFEDGVKQKVESFRFLATEAGSQSELEPKKPAEPGTTPANITPTPAPQPARSTPSVTALVFDRLSPEARSLARKAGLAYTQEGTTTGDFTGVFSIDQSLRTIQPFTENSELVRVGVETATSSATSGYSSGAAKIRENADRSIVLDQQISAGATSAAAAGAARDGGGASAAGAGIGQAAAEQKLLEMQTQMLDQYERLERDQQGFSTINSLLAVISPMQNLPGRKTIIFFSEGLKLPPSVQAKFPAVINAANRANVSIYTIDAGGLRVESGTAEAARELNSLAASRLQQQSRGNDTGVNGPYTRALERNEDLLRFDPRSGLGDLADETGGILIHDTNDLVAGLRRINEDMRGYYLLTYVPENKEYDGRFRQVSVKVDRSSVDVQSRKGYYAVESMGQLPMLDYEAPALAAARRAATGPSSFPFHGAALSYPTLGRAGLSLVLAEAPMAAFKFSPSADNKTYNANFSIVALVRDQSDQVVQKLSQNYTMTGPIEKMGGARQGDVLFYREAQLSPGKYNVQLIAYDANTNTASIRSSSLDVPASDETKPRLSSLAVLKRAEKLSAEEQKRDQPFHFGELLVYPNLGEPIEKSATKQLAFFFTAWPPKGSSSPLKLTLQILQNQKSLGQTSGDLPAPDAQGQIKYASAIPLDKFQPGVFELKITVSDGKNAVSRSTKFTVES
jgi:VWFA-related protein